MSNKKFFLILGIDDICISINAGIKIILKDMNFVPNLCLNLLSAGKLDEDGYTSSFGKKCWKLTRGLLVAAKGKKCCNLYKT